MYPSLGNEAGLTELQGVSAVAETLASGGYTGRSKALKAVTIRTANLCMYHDTLST